MTIAYWCVLATVIMPLLLAGIAKAGAGRPYDNHKPREFLASLQGYQQRANWAQQNAYEAFAPFAAAVIIAHQLNLAQATLDTYALTFVAARVLYSLCYVKDWALLRSLAWTVGFACVIGLFVAAA